ncbi:hypothetical protein BLNAU_16827 [Blattamonas nauphoetae]|uniref:Transmembrane protein n=1 Tax=Blattamonas nauphoetae TaxID=2049346 RepID=A0ABQ9X844_9EUKA|nr:hypothetical protein BLNAU_16827 [Blattamonas nauphoetae]
MNPSEQQRFTIVARGCTTPMVILLIVGILLLGTAIPLCIIFEIGFLGIGIGFPLIPILIGLVFGGLYGRRTTITVDMADSSFVMTVKDGFLRRMMSCCCKSGMVGTHTYKFTDVLRVNSTPALGQSVVVIYFVNGYIFNSVTNFKTVDAMRFGQAVNGYLMQHAPQNLEAARTLPPPQLGYGMQAGYPPLTGYALPPSYGQPPVGYVGSSQPPAVLYSAPQQPVAATGPDRTISKE